MMSLPIRPQPLRKLPVVWHCPCHQKKICFSPSLFCLCPSVCTHRTPSCVCIWNESPALDEGVTPSCGTPRPDGLTVSLSSLCQHRPGQTLCCPGAERKKERKDFKPVTIMLYLEAYSALTALTRSFEHRRVTKTSSRLICVGGLQLLSKLLQTWICDATSNQCPSLNTRGRHCSVADEKPLHWGSRYARWAICHYMGVQ